MEINLHLLPEFPDRSCDVVEFHRNPNTGNIHLIISGSYDAARKMFNCNPLLSDDYIEKNAESMANYQIGIVAWAYKDEVSQEVLECLNRSKLVA